MMSRIGFLVLRLFPMYTLMVATDALRLANKYAGYRAFDWALLSSDGAAVEASNGISIDCDLSVREANGFSHIFVVAGDDQTRSLTQDIRRWLVKNSRTETILGAIDSGAFILATCRVIRNRSITIHPGAVAAFQEEYPDIDIKQEPFLRDRSLLTSAGGMATTPMMLSMITELCGPDISKAVAEDMVTSWPSLETGSPPDGRRPESAVPSAVEAVVQIMQSFIEEPMQMDQLVQRAGISRRQMTRLFRKTLGRSPMEYYRTMRLMHAKQLLFQSELSISAIAAASGFQSLSAFSRSFSSEFKQSPRELLETLRRQGNAAAVPSENLRKRIKRSRDGHRS